MQAEPGFLMLTCQVGVEAAVKQEFARRLPGARFAYSRPGFMTFKLPPDHGLPADLGLDAVFARACAYSLGKATGDSQAERVAAVQRLTESRSFAAIHVWQRDLRAAGDHGYEPQPTLEAATIEAELRAALSPGGDLPPSLVATSDGQLVAHPTPVGADVLDCVLVEPHEWWIGLHRAGPWASRWSGGLRPLVAEGRVASRAYHKMQEALDWSGLPIKAGELFAEIGCAPGGSSQALLERGLNVLGVDPAEVDAEIAAHPHFVQLRKRGHEVRRREFRRTRWLSADMNVAPGYTLDTVEAIVTHPETEIRGLLLTLKLPELRLAAEIPAWIERVRGWGFAQVAARQLQHNRREICLAARRG